MKSGLPYVRALVWKNIIFFGITTGLTFAVPFYIYSYGLSGSAAVLFLFYAWATGLGITVGYHRLYAHASYKAHPLLQFILLFFGAASFEQSALKWAAQHRIHHLCLDTEKDPYSVKQGFWHAHIGWLLFWQRPKDYDNVNDLKANRMVMHQHRYYPLWAITAGIVTPVVIGAFAGDALGAFLVGVCARLTFVYHATFCINSVCHKFGAATYDLRTTAKDNWLTALVTYGEGFHNFHHRFPSDYRNGIRWYHWDPSKWLIRALSLIGLSRDLKKVSPFAVLHARLYTEHQTAAARLAEKVRPHPVAEQVVETIQARFRNMQRRLAAFENASVEYQLLLKQKISDRSAELTRLRREASKRLHLRRMQFKAYRARWNRSLRTIVSQWDPQFTVAAFR
jgi:stearoyl-CoA desaturase (delta-9 desaturase)